MPKNSMLPILAGAMLASCVTHQEVPSYSGPVAPPQAAYRIDDHRYFEIVPKESHACFWANLFYVDTARGIRALVTSWDRTNYGRLVIDAATDQYLVSPIIGTEPNCHTGDYASTMCDPRLRYSIDGGRTWRVTIPKNAAPHGEVYLTGDSVYFSGQRARLSDLIAGDGAWTAFPLGRQNKLPPLVKPPIDDDPNCDESKTVKAQE